jgi:hypothetical protein
MSPRRSTLWATLPPTAPESDLRIPFDYPERITTEETHDSVSADVTDLRSLQAESPASSTTALPVDSSRAVMKDPTGTPSVSTNSVAPKASGDRLIIREINVDAPFGSQDG